MAVILAGATVWALGWDRVNLHLIGPLPHGLPIFQNPWPGWGRCEELLAGALALAIIGMIESVSIAKSIAIKTGENISANQEFFTQGLKNFVSSFWGCIPGSGSFTRSILDYAAGAQTRFAAVFNAVFVGVIFFLLAEQARFVPMAALAAVLFVIAYDLIDWHHLRLVLRSSRSDTLVCLVTLLATLLLPLEYAVFAGIFLNIGLYLRVASRLHLVQMVPTSSGPFLERPLHVEGTANEAIFLQMEGELFFGVADELGDQLARISRSDVKLVILRLKRTHSIDATVLGVLEQFFRDIRSRGGYVLLCGLRPVLTHRLRTFGLIDLLGEDNVFQAAPGIFTSAKQALARARTILGKPISAADVDLEEPEQSAYEI
jgi:SulP family sulfate permease